MSITPQQATEVRHRAYRRSFRILTIEKWLRGLLSHLIAATLLLSTLSPLSFNVCGRERLKAILVRCHDTRWEFTLIIKSNYNQGETESSFQFHIVITKSRKKLAD